MLTHLRALLLAAATGLTLAPAASAVPVFATEVAEYNEGAGIASAARRVTGNALGAPDGAFLSLGLGGSAIFGFGTAFSTSVTIDEVTFGSRPGHVEMAQIFGLKVLGGPATLLGSITNTAASATLNFAGIFNYLQVVDTSPALAGRDGFDIDAISTIAVAPIPLPTAGGLLALGLLGFAALRRRRAVQA